MSSGSALNRPRKRRLATDFNSQEATPEEAHAPIRDQLRRTEKPTCRRRNLDPSVHPSAFAHERGTTGASACTLQAGVNPISAVLDRLLDPGNPSVTLETLTRAARAIGRDLRIELV